MEKTHCFKQGSVIEHHGLFLGETELHGLRHVAAVLGREGGEAFHLVLQDQPIPQT